MAVPAAGFVIDNSDIVYKLDFIFIDKISLLSFLL
jgi:hypothetical protein